MSVDGFELQQLASTSMIQEFSTLEPEEEERLRKYEPLIGEFIELSKKIMKAVSLEVV